MASRESTGLQVALILFVIMTVVLGVTTYLYFRKTEEKIAEADQVSSELTKVKASRDKALFQIQFLHHIIGHDRLDGQKLESLLTELQADTGVMQIEQNYNNDVAMYGVGLDDALLGDLTYRTLPEKLIVSIRSLHKRLEEKDRIIARKDQEYSVATKTHVDIKTGLQAEYVKLNDKYTTEKQTFDAKISEVVDVRKGLKTKLDGQVAIVRDQKSRYNEDTKALAEQIENQSIISDSLKKKIADLQDRSFETPDGLIVRTNQAANIVYINLGSRDGLERQVTFSVYDQDENAVDKAEPKARIEVTEILQGGQAEARILEDSTTNPILPGDKIFSPAWSPGRRIHFALAGKMDINDDGIDDRVKVRNIIKMSGGLVDGELHQDGKETGEMTLDTTYLVRGKPPTEKSNDEYRQAYTSMMSRAKDLNIEVISASKLLNIMGWKPEERTVTLGRGRGGDVSPRAPKPKSDDNGGFRTRKPGSAF
jgi:hypothetical protein